MKKEQVIQISIVYDNLYYDKGLDTDWGFSCFIKGIEKSILFDTGAKGNILLSNMEKLNISSSDIDFVFLSHNHKDHTGGLDNLIECNSEIKVWVPEFFPSVFIESIRQKGSIPFKVNDFQKICDRVYTTGVISGWIKEQSLLLDTDKGLILITGCSHPRILNIISIVKERMNKDIYLVMGGFHLAGFSKDELSEIINGFKSEGVRKVGPCHCTGSDAIKLFAQEYKNDFIEVGAGRNIKL